MVTISKKQVLATLSSVAAVAALSAVGAQGVEQWRRKNGKTVSTAIAVSRTMGTVTALTVVALLVVIFAWDDSEAAKAEEGFRAGDYSPKFGEKGIVEPIFDPVSGKPVKIIDPIFRDAYKHLNKRVRQGPHKF